jgi:PRC-barrel domain
MSDDKRDGRQLCYLEASKVEGRDGDLAGLTVQTEGNETLGTLDGVLIDPTERRLRYFVVETRGLLRRRRYLLSADVPVRVEPDKHRLRVDAANTDVDRSDEFDVRTVRPFSSEDAIDAMFSRDLTAA